MIKSVNLRLSPREAADKESIKRAASQKIGATVDDFRILRKSIDSRQRNIWIDLEVEVATDGSTLPKAIEDYGRRLKDVADSPQVVIVGAGPAGLFAALRCIELGLKPVVVERGKPVERRLHDVVRLQKEKSLDPESNFCFGEGGAGAFSDGKLYTRSKKRGNVKEILEILYHHGAKEEVLYEAHPHIGSDRLPAVIRAIRENIMRHGGEIRFETRFRSLLIEGDRVEGIVTGDGEKIYGPVILATGHSARDVYEELHRQGVELEPKGFAMGVRLEHPQHLIDQIFYHSTEGRGKWLPAAEYGVNCQVDGRGVYSFCMCPGGVIVPAMTEKDQLVVNGMSASGRSGRWANSGMVVEIRPEDYPEYLEKGPLGLMEFQKETEERFFKAGGTISAPAQRMKDFVENKVSSSLPRTSYVPGIYSADIGSLFHPSVADRLRRGLEQFGRKYKGFLTNDAVLIGLESRTSSPVRIPRERDTFCHPRLKGLYPVGEGAGYAGGIVSAAIDGRNAVDAIVNQKLL